MGGGAAAKAMIFSACPSPTDPSEVENDDSVTWPSCASVVLVVCVEDEKMFEVIVRSVTPHSPKESSICVPFEVVAA